MGIRWSSKDLGKEVPWPVIYKFALNFRNTYSPDVLYKVFKHLIFK